MAMNASYDPCTDTLSIVLRDGPVADSDEVRPGVVLDYDVFGELLSLEIRDASKRVRDPATIDFRILANT